VVARILLSTDTVQETKQVNSSKLSVPIQIVANPAFRDSTKVTLSARGLTSIEVTLTTGTFIQGKELSPSMFVISGVNQFSTTGSGLDAAKQILASGLRVVRLSDTKALLYGPWGLVNDLHSGLIDVTVKSTAYRQQTDTTNAITLAANAANSGPAFASGDIVLVSGTNRAGTSGVTLTIELANGIKFDPKVINADWNDTFIDDLLDSNSFYTAQSGLFRELTFSGVVDNATSGVLTLTITGAIDPDALIANAVELKLEIKDTYTVGANGDIVVLTAPANIVLTANPKLTIAILED
jgi:hypothetical protein